MKRILPILVLAILSACYYDNEEQLYPNTGQCDTTNVTFSGTILPMITSNCSSCHSGSNPVGIILLEDHPTISAAAAIPAGQAGSLYGAISYNPLNKPMPQNAAQLTDCQILQVKVWIDAGTPDN
jgi:hypothetical protein